LPKANLNDAGRKRDNQIRLGLVIRAQRHIEEATVKSRTLTCITAMMIFAVLATPVRPTAQVTGSGTTNFIPKWTGSTTLGNSALFQSGGQVGIGTTSPAARLNVIGLKGTIGVNGGNAPTALQVTGGLGVTNSGGFGMQGAGGPIQVMSGTGASLPGLTARGGTGAVIMITGGDGANCIPGATRCAAEIGGNGGSVALQPGAGGFGRTSSGHPGNVILAPTGGNVGIGTTSPSAKLYVTGNFIATGTKSAVVETASYGKRQLYAVESPENWFEDFGGAQLVHGRATVKLDPIFAETVSAEDEYHVFLTPKGDCKGLYVAGQSASSFEVRELRHGKGTIAFDYRVVARRKGYERARLSELKDGGDTDRAEMTLAKQ
jgi:hypothetical protein